MRRPWPSGVSDKSKRHAEELKPQLGRKMVPAKEFDIYVCKELWLEQLQLRSCGEQPEGPLLCSLIKMRFRRPPLIAELLPCVKNIIELQRSITYR